MIQLVNAVYRDDHVKRIDKAVLVYIAHRIGKTGSCFASVRTIARQTGFSKSAVENAIKRLVDTEILVLRHRGTNKNGDTNHYGINVDHLSNWKRNAVPRHGTGSSNSKPYRQAVQYRQTVQGVPPQPSSVPPDGTDCTSGNAEQYRQTVHNKQEPIVTNINSQEEPAVNGISDDEIPFSNEGFESNASQQGFNQSTDRESQSMGGKQPQSPPSSAAPPLSPKPSADEQEAEAYKRKVYESQLAQAIESYASHETSEELERIAANPNEPDCHRDAAKRVLADRKARIAKAEEEEVPF